MPDLTLANRPLLVLPRDGDAFAGAGHGFVRVSFSDATFGVFVVGGTGAGKTESIMRPVLSELLSKGCSGLILDHKGDYSSMCDAEFADRTITVGTTVGAVPVNLIAGMSEERFREMLASLTDGSRVGTTNGAYFATMGVDAAYLALLHVRYAREREPSLADIAHYLTRPRELCRELAEYERRTELPGPLAEQIQIESQNTFGILAVGGYLARDPNHTPDARQMEQWSWATNAVRSVLSPFATNPVLRRQFCSGENLDFGRLLYTEGRSVVLDCPAARYGAVASIASRILRLRFQDAVRTSDPAERDRASIGRDRYTFLLVDEYQSFVVADASAGIFADADWFATSRSYGNINVISTQGISMLLARGDRYSVDAIVQNCRTKVFLGVEDEATLNLAATLGFGHEQAVRQQLLYSNGVGTGFVYVKHCGFEKGRTVAARFDCSLATDFAYMRRYIGRPFPARPQLTADDIAVESAKAPTPSATVEVTAPGYEWVSSLLGIGPEPVTLAPGMRADAGKRTTPSEASAR